jgi:hypothetical protein
LTNPVFPNQTVLSIQAIDKEVKQEVVADVKRAKAGSQPEASILNEHIHVSKRSGFQVGLVSPTQA